MDNTKRQYRVYQTLTLTIQKDFFENKFPTNAIEHIEKMITDSIMTNLDTSIQGIKTITVHIEDLTR